LKPVKTSLKIVLLSKKTRAPSVLTIPLLVRYLMNLLSLMYLMKIVILALMTITQKLENTVANGLVLHFENCLCGVKQVAIILLEILSGQLKHSLLKCHLMSRLNLLISELIAQTQNALIFMQHKLNYQMDHNHQYLVRMSWALIPTLTLNPIGGLKTMTCLISIQLSLILKHL